MLQPGDLGQANRYTYVSNNPMNLTDPAGLNACGINDDADRVYNCGKKKDISTDCGLATAGLALSGAGTALSGGVALGVSGAGLAVSTASFARAC